MHALKYNHNQERQNNNSFWVPCAISSFKCSIIHAILRNPLRDPVVISNWQKKKRHTTTRACSRLLFQFGDSEIKWANLSVYQRLFQRQTLSLYHYSSVRRKSMSGEKRIDIQPCDALISEFLRYKRAERVEEYSFVDKVLRAPQRSALVQYRHPVGILRYCTGTHIVMEQWRTGGKDQWASLSLPLQAG